MGRTRAGLVIVGVALAAGGLWIASRETPQGAIRPPSPQPSATDRVGAAPRRATLRVENQALGKSRRRVASAVSALKRIRLWERLTRHLYIVRIGSRPGSMEIPDDGHLADAYLRGQIDDRGAGGVCDVMFYPRAMKDDLARAHDYYAQGLAGPPPSLGDFWAAILAHELAHCLPYVNPKGLPRQAPEPLAEKWEERVRSRLQG